MIHYETRCRECGLETRIGHDIGCTMPGDRHRMPQDRRNPPGVIRVARGSAAPLWRLLGMRWRWEALSPRFGGLVDADGWAWSRRAAIRKARRFHVERAEPDWQTIEN